MKKRINLIMCMLSIFTCIVTFISSVIVGHKTAFERMKIDTRRQAHLVAAGIEYIHNLEPDEQRKYLQSVGKSDRSRITLILENGDVVYDSNSESSKMENHLNRKEVYDAINTGKGESSRTSDTLGQKTYYFAKRLSTGDVLRVSNTTDLVIDDFKKAMPLFLIIIFIVVILSVLIANSLTKKIIQPINRLRIDRPLENDIYEELSPFLQKIHLQNRKIKEQFEKMRHQQVELEAITSNMSEGIIVVDGQLRILSINNAAKKLMCALNQNFIDKSIIALNREQMFIKKIAQAIEGKKTEYRMKNNDEKHLQIFNNPVQIDGKIRGCVILIVDISEKYEVEQSRREFTANVSHELKTPLTSISGYAELISNGMAKPEDIKSFAQKIQNESARLLELVNDIIKLSKLDEGAIMKLKFEKVNIKNLLLNVENRMRVYAHKKNIKMHIKSDDINVLCVSYMLEEAIENLCSNAIKYNKDGGNVWIDTKEYSNKICIEVKDDGIGIAENDKKHIFERFYRADKSHSKTIEGTGLGLAIVRHALQIHGGSVDVHSKEGEGSIFIMILPKE